MPTVSAPGGGQQRRFPYSPQGQEQAQVYAAQSGGEVQNRGYGRPNPGRQPPPQSHAPPPMHPSQTGAPMQQHPGAMQQYQQQSARDLMGYMPQMRSQPGSYLYNYDPMEVWHSIYDLMGNPQLSAGMGGAQGHYLAQLTQPIKQMRLGGPQPLPFPQGPGPGPVGAYSQPVMPNQQAMNPMMQQGGQQFQGPYTPQGQF